MELLDLNTLSDLRLMLYSVLYMYIMKLNALYRGAYFTCIELNYWIELFEVYFHWSVEKGGKDEARICR